MKLKWLHQNSSSDLIVFCNGWGMDEGVVNHLTSTEYDLVMLYSYSALKEPAELSEILSTYENRQLVAWSMGVWVGQRIFGKYRDMFSQLLAINGTLCPMHDRYGIPEEVFRSTLENYGEEARAKFYRRMCRQKTNLKQFLANEPQRSVEDQRQELDFLATSVDCIPAEHSIFTKAVISDQDWVVPSENQRNYWRDCETLHLAGFHYMFPLFQSWAQLLQFSETGSH